MDFIIKKLDRRIRLSQPGSAERRSCLQARIEYLYYLMLGYLWNKYHDQLSIEEISRFVNDLQGRLTIGTIIKSINQFDKIGELSNDQLGTCFEKYRQYRNDNIGHGYIFGDGTEKDEEALAGFYEDIMRCVPFLNQKMDIVVVNECLNEKCSCFLYKEEDKGEAEPISLHSGILDLAEAGPNVYYRIRSNNNYFRVSPFILVEGIDAKVYIFHKIEQKLTGKTTYTPLYASGKVSREIAEFINTGVTDKYCAKSANNTMMNPFKQNFRKYIEFGLTNKLKEYLRRSAFVSAVLWGNGGVGKTACVQKVCQDLFNDSVQTFEYIVFVTAKDRRFNEITGKVESFDNSQNFWGIISAIYSTQHGMPLEYQEDSPEFEAVVDEIKQMNGNPEKGIQALLLVVDDFETFSDEEKNKISSFVGCLNARTHKVVITTRNKQLASGEYIPAGELKIGETIAFLKEKIQENYPECADEFGCLIKDKVVRQKIHEATGGVPIFILQWLHLYVQKPTEEVLYDQLGVKEAARDFLSGRVYNSLRDNAKKLYAVLSITTSSDQTFLVERLRYVCRNSMTSDAFDDALQELEQLCIIEQYQIDDQNKAESVYRVYTKSFLDDMRNRFDELAPSIRDQIKGSLKTAGGQSDRMSLYDSLMTEARKTQGAGSETATVSKYRHIIKFPDFTLAQRRQAHIELLSYYCNYQSDLDKMIETQRNCPPEFARDPDVLYKYIYYLWGGTEAEYKAVAFEELKAYFSENECISSKNIRFYGLGVAYFTIYILSSSIEMEKALITKAYNINISLFRYVTSAQEEEDKQAIESFRHEIKVALLHAVRLLVNLTIGDRSYAEMCNTIAEYFLSHYPDSHLECASVKKLLNSIQSLTPSVEAAQNLASLKAIPEGCVAFLPQYIKMHANGLPQFLNGFVNGVKSGVAFYDIEKFGWEVSNYGTISDIMETLRDQAVPIPAVITAVNPKGMYTLSLYNTGMTLREIMNWNKKPLPPIGSIVEFTATRLYERNGKYQGIIGYVDSEDNKALLHISQIHNSFIMNEEMEKLFEICSRLGSIDVRLEEVTDRGLQASLIDMTPGFEELLKM